MPAIECVCVVMSGLAVLDFSGTDIQVQIWRFQVLNALAQLLPGFLMCHEPYTADKYSSLAKFLMSARRSSVVMSPIP
jgi:hypothetical protein